MLPKSAVLRVGKSRCNATLTFAGSKVRFSFGFNTEIKDHIKVSLRARWDNEAKEWVAEYNHRTQFQLDYMEGKNPYQIYDLDLVDYKSQRPLYLHQLYGVRHLITRRSAFLGSEMGCGKTLMAIEMMEHFQATEGKTVWYWVGPRAALRAVELEFKKWKSKVKPTFITYNSLHKYAHVTPDGIIFDESSKLKTWTVKRTEVAVELTNKMRDRALLAHEVKPIIVLMSGTPSPKNPMDWWSQIEITCPGYLKEGHPLIFRDRLAVVEQKEGLAGNKYPEIVAWRDGQCCTICGVVEEAHILADHRFLKSRNEVELLGTRLKGIALIQFKRDCLDLPDKTYRMIKCPPSSSMLRAVEVLRARSGRAIEFLTNCREISDGFLYFDKVTDKLVKCEACDGTGKQLLPDEDKCAILEIDLTQANVDKPLPMISVNCPTCDGTGKVFQVVRSLKTCDTPKDKALVELLEEFEDIGRLVIYCGFQGTVDKVMSIVNSKGWDYLKVDGRGWVWSKAGPTRLKEYEMLERFQNPSLPDSPEKLVFIGQPGAGGMGLTLTKSPAIIFYSNDFNGESRMQAEDRIHRPGMDPNLGATIIDLICLDSDYLVLDNLKKKKDLQSMTMEQLNSFTVSDQSNVEILNEGQD